MKNDLSSVRIIDDTGYTRVRLSDPRDDRTNVPREIVVRNADKLAWSDAITDVEFDTPVNSVQLYEHHDGYRGRVLADFDSPGKHTITDHSSGSKWKGYIPFGKSRPSNRRKASSVKIN